MSEIRLNGEQHETVLTELRGKFSMYCGCGWQVWDLSMPEVLAAEKRHLEAQEWIDADR